MMKLNSVIFHTSRLSEIRDFYEEKLGLPTGTYVKENKTVPDYLETSEVSRSTLNPGLMVFGAAKLTLLDSAGKNMTQSFEGGDGYFDLHAQVIVLRDLKHSVYRELIYDVNLQKVVYF